MSMLITSFSLLGTQMGSHLAGFEVPKAGCRHGRGPSGACGCGSDPASCPLQTLLHLLSLG